MTIIVRDPHRTKNVPWFVNLTLGSRRRAGWDTITEVNAAYYVDLYANGSVVFAVCGKASDFYHTE
jgi:hypothetical protein